MEYDQIVTVVELSARMRSPTFGGDTRLPQKIGKLEDYILACANTRGELEDAYRWVCRLVTKLTDQWEDIDADGKTARERAAEKRSTEEGQAVYGALQDATQLKRDCERQIHRLEKDEATNSRAYTFITGHQ